MMRSIQRRLVLVAFTATALSPSCNDADDTTGLRAVARAVGTIEVTVTTSGPDPDDTGYLVTVDSISYFIAPNTSLRLNYMAAGSRNVRLDRVATNCRVLEPNPQWVTVSPNATATASFSVICTARATVRVTAMTSGSPPDPDGYFIRLQSLASDTSAFVRTAGIASFSVAAGSHFISLVGLAANCRVAAHDGGPTRQIVVLEGEAAELSFTVTCVSGEASQIAFVRGGRIFRANADGTGIVQLTSGPNDGQPAWSPDGRRIAFTRQSDRRNEWGNAEPDVYVMDADGTNVELLTSAARFMRQPAWSPDGRKIAVAHQCNDGTGCIMIVPAQADGTVPARVGFDRGVVDSPAWSPDGGKIAFTSDWRFFDFYYDLYVMDADGSSASELVQVPNDYTYYFQPAWSPDGGRIALVVCSGSCEPRSAIAIVNADGSGLTMLAEARGFAKPTWSPDGRTLAFTSSTCGIVCSADIYVVGADGKGLRLLIADGSSPAWRR